MRTPCSLATLGAGRDNNLNLMRVLAATAVLISHSYVIATGDPKAEPWLATLGMSPGSVAVDVFFVLSGFLVTGSLLKSTTLWPFVVARALRIYPGLWAALLVSTLVVGAGFSTLDFQAFLHEMQTWRYLGRNALMITGAEAQLPGAFTRVPFADVVNGSLWTLRWELRLYAALGLLWWALCRLPASPRVAGERMARAVSGVTLLLMLAAIGLAFVGRPSDAVTLGAMFFAGASFWLHRHRIPMRSDWALFICAALACSAAVSPLAFEVVYRLASPYLMFYAAFVPAGRLRRYNQLGDYSYGIYVYAFPVQQMVETLRPGMSTWALTGMAGVVTVVLAVISWHSVEQPALRLKARAAQFRLPRRRMRSVDRSAE